MFIETEGTPNPATLKFLPGRDVMGGGTADFATAASAERSPLAHALFQLPGVARVFLGGDFITVTKSDLADWQALRPEILGAVMDHFVAGRPVMEGASAALNEDVAPEDREIVEQIKELLGYARSSGGRQRRRGTSCFVAIARALCCCICRVRAPAARPPQPRSNTA